MEIISLPQPLNHISQTVPLRAAVAIPLMEERKVSHIPSVAVGGKEAATP